MNKTDGKKQYSNPQIEQIRLDNEISLVLMSDPGEPGIGASLSTEYLNKSPFQTTIV